MYPPPHLIQTRGSIRSKWNMKKVLLEAETLLNEDRGMKYLAEDPKENEKQSLMYSKNTKLKNVSILDLIYGSGSRRWAVWTTRMSLCRRWAVWTTRMSSQGMQNCS